MGIASRPSRILIPAGCDATKTVIEFLIDSFPAISESLWKERILGGKVHWENGEKVTLNTLCRELHKVCYYREVESEVEVPFKEQVVFQNDHFLIACKPHFLPVVPSGSYVENCLLNRLIKSTGITSLNPAHRIDRDTAGLVLFSKHPDERKLYQGLFVNGGIEKTYHAVTHCIESPESRWHLGQTIENRIVEAEPRFRRKVSEEGEVNARSWAQLLSYDALNQAALFSLKPITGKTHQLRVHMAHVGMPLVNDPYYPVLQPKAQALAFEKPLQLLAKTIAFNDPVSGEAFSFESGRSLHWPLAKGV
jgi:tRNA pseudouridine32 synthase/23S rRNA pseudouridine746 synthase